MPEHYRFLNSRARRLLFFQHTANARSHTLSAAVANCGGNNSAAEHSGINELTAKHKKVLSAQHGIERLTAELNESENPAATELISGDSRNPCGNDLCAAQAPASGKGGGNAGSC